jgi:hypothetical protein
MEYEPLIQGNYYHIFNRGNNRSNLFSKPEEYEQFLHLYDKYISPVADTLAWSLMRNHFHLLVYIKKDRVYKYSVETLNRISPDKNWYEEHKWETVDADLSASTRPDNVGLGMYNNVGNVNAVNPKDLDRLRNVDRLKKPVPYRHFGHLFNNNPIHHGFCDHPLEYPWTSYLTSISEKQTKLKREEVIKLFNNTENFKQQHNQEIDIVQIEKWLEIAPSDLHDFDLSTKVDADMVDAENVDAEVFDADRSMDADRSGEDFDLSACNAPDNVKMVNIKTKSNN